MTAVREPTAEGSLERDGVELHWLEWAPEAGQGEPPALFLLHGLSSNARYWERLARRFPHRRLVAFDQRAHGASGAPPDGYSLEALTGDAAFAIEALGLGRPVVAGHSWGAFVALDLAAARPDLVAGIATIDGALSSMRERLSWEEASKVMQSPLPRYPDLETAYADSRRYLDEAWDADLEAFVASGLRRDGDAWVLPLTAGIRLQFLRELYGFQPEVAWASAPGPALAAVAAGDVAMRSWKDAGARRVREVRPDVDIRWYDSRHDIPLIRADEIAADLERLCLRAAFLEAAREAEALGGDWARPSPLEGWSAKDVLAHVSSSVAALPAVLDARGEPPPGSGSQFDPDRWNAAMVRRRAERSVEELIDELRAAAEQLDVLLVDEDLARPVAAGPDAGRPAGEALRIAAGHALEHLRQLR